MDTYNLQGLVFRSVDYGETSKILTVFTKEKGIISVMARGVKGPKSKKQNLVAPYTEVNFELNKSRDFYYLKDGEIINDNLGLRKSLLNIYLTQFFLYIIENTYTENFNEEDHYNLLTKTLKYLGQADERDKSLKVASMFLIKYISMIGYRPNLFACSICKKRKFKEIHFSHQLGGVHCQDHESLNFIRLSFAEYEYLNKLLVEIFENIATIGKGVDIRKIFKLIIDFIIYNIDIRIPKALKIIYKFVGIN